MKISIITVSYNSADTIEGAIKSVLSQKYHDVEYIIIDGESKDNTLNIVRKFKNDISAIISESDNGIYDAMNKGIMLSTGDVIGVLNSDDLYADSNVLMDVMSNFIADEKLDIVFGNLVYVRRNDIYNVIRNWHSRTYFDKFFEFGNVPPHPALFVRRHVYQKAGLFNLQYKLSADYEFMLRIFKKYDFNSKYINRLIVIMRLGGATNKSLKNIIKGNYEILMAWKNNELKIPLTLMPLRFVKRLIQFF